jgi:hypothetical protein
MILHWLILFISLVFINIYADVNKAQHLILTIAEHNKPNDSPEQPSKPTSEKILIR